MTPMLILATPDESTGKSKQACKVMARSFKGYAGTSGLLVGESIYSSFKNFLFFQNADLSRPIHIFPAL